MRIAISNIAWDTEEDDQIVGLLERHGINAIDVAPGKYFPDPISASDKEIKTVKTWWADRDIEITGMQSLLFGTSGLNLFGSHETQDAMLNHLSAVCRIGSGLGATRLVFGSPKNRDRAGLTDEQTEDTALRFFSRLGDIAASHGVIICLEPNPSCYGANFMTSFEETQRVVRGIGHSAIRMQLDTGAITINKEDISQLLPECKDLIGHIHASEPNLVPLGDGGANHRQIFDVVNRFLPDHIVSVEMVATKDEPHLVSIERALAIATNNYRRANEV
jgi:sugar phosphate isomerase/epimerase